MVKMKEMPSSEKYAIIMDNINHSFVPSFISKHLGEHAAIELQNIWREEFEAIPDDASFDEKYETAYRNWIWMAKNNLNFIRIKMGEEGKMGEKTSRACVRTKGRLNRESDGSRRGREQQDAGQRDHAGTSSRQTYHADADCCPPSCQPPNQRARMQIVKTS